MAEHSNDRYWDNSTLVEHYLRRRYITVSLLAFLTAIMLCVLLCNVIFFVSVELKRDLAQAENGIRAGWTLYRAPIVQFCLIVPVAWVCVGILLFNTVLANLAIVPRAHRGLVDVTTRFLSALPTVLLGALFVRAIPFSLETAWTRDVAVAIAIVVSALPTAIQIALPAAETLGTDEYLAVRSLGIDRLVAYSQFLLRRVRRSFTVALSTSISRVLVEATIVLGALQTTGRHGSALGTGIDAGNIMISAYAVVTAKTNIYVIILLIIVAVFGRVWASAISANSNT